MLPVADVVKSRRRENVRGEPSVGSLEDAFRCFMGTELDVLAVGNCYLRKEREDPALKQNYESAFELD
jgi:carbamoyltransferase